MVAAEGSVCAEKVAEAGDGQVGVVSRAAHGALPPQLGPACVVYNSGPSVCLPECLSACRSVCLSLCQEMSIKHR